MSNASELYSEEHLALNEFRVYAHRMDEVYFYFLSDTPDEEDRWVGYMEADHYKGFWVGGCDIPDGTSFPTVESMLIAPIYDGRSLKDCWDEVRISSISGFSVSDFLQMVPF